MCQVRLFLSASPSHMHVSCEASAYRWNSRLKLRRTKDNLHQSPSLSSNCWKEKNTNVDLQIFEVVSPTYTRAPVSFRTLHIKPTTHKNLFPSSLINVFEVVAQEVINCDNLSQNDSVELLNKIMSTQTNKLTPGLGRLK